MKKTDTGEGPGVTIRSVAQAPVWKHLLWGAVALLGLWALSQIPSTLIVFSMAWLIAYLLNPAVDALTGSRLGPLKACSRGQAVAIVASLLLGAMVAAGSLMLPQLTDQVERLLSIQQKLGDPRELPIMLREKAEPLLARIPEQYRETAMSKVSILIQDSASKIGYGVSELIRSVGAFIGQLLSAIFLVSSAFLVSLYMLMNWHNLAGDLLEKLPRQYQREVRSLSVKLNEIFGGYLKATILTAIACMIATFVSLFLLKWGFGLSGQEVSFPYKGLVAFVAGISYPIPVVGIIATSILGGVLGLVSDGPFFGLCVLAMINVVNVLIDRTVQPRLMSDAIGVSELFVMFAAFAGGEVAGVWGMLLGIPVAAMGKTLFEWFHANFLLVDEPAIQASINVKPSTVIELPPSSHDPDMIIAAPIVVEQTSVSNEPPLVTAATLESTPAVTSPPLVEKSEGATIEAMKSIEVVAPEEPVAAKKPAPASEPVVVAEPPVEAKEPAAVEPPPLAGQPEEVTAPTEEPVGQQLTAVEETPATSEPEVSPPPPGPALDPAVKSSSKSSKKSKRSRKKT